MIGRSEKKMKTTTKAARKTLNIDKKDLRQSEKFYNNKNQLKMQRIRDDRTSVFPQSLQIELRIN